MLVSVGMSVGVELASTWVSVGVAVTSMVSVGEKVGVSVIVAVISVMSVGVGVGVIVVCTSTTLISTKNG